MSNQWKDKFINIELFPLIFKFSTNPSSFETIDNIFNLVALISIEFDCEEFIFSEPTSSNEKINCINRFLHLISNDQLKKYIDSKRSIINNIYELAELLSFNRPIEFVKKCQEFDRITNHPNLKAFKINHFGEFKKEFNIDRFNKFLDDYNQFKINETELKKKFNLINKQNNTQQQQQINQLTSRINEFDELIKIRKLTDFKDKILEINFKLSLNYFKNYYIDYKIDDDKLILDIYSKINLQKYLNKFTICNLSRRESNFYFTNQDIELIINHSNLMIKLINLRNNYYTQYLNVPNDQISLLNFYTYQEQNLLNQKKNLSNQKFWITSEEYDIQKEYDQQKSFQKKIIYLEDAHQIEEIKSKIKILQKEKQLIIKNQKILIKQANKLHSNLLKSEIKNRSLENELNKKIEINKLYSLLNEQLDYFIDYIQLITKSIVQKNIRSNFEKRIKNLDEQDMKIDEQKIILDNELSNLRKEHFELSNKILLETKILPDEMTKQQKLLESFKRQELKLRENEADREKLLDHQGEQIRKEIELQIGKSIEEYTEEYLILEDIQKKAIKLEELTETTTATKYHYNFNNYYLDKKIYKDYQQIKLYLEEFIETIKLLQQIYLQKKLSSQQQKILQTQQEQILSNLKSIKDQLQLINDSSQIFKEQKQLCLEYLFDKILFIRRTIVSDKFFKIYHAPPSIMILEELSMLQKQLLLILPEISKELITKLPQISTELKSIFQPSSSSLLQHNHLKEKTPQSIFTSSKDDQEILQSTLSSSKSGGEEIEPIYQEIIKNLVGLKTTIQILQSLSNSDEIQQQKQELSQVLQTQQKKILLNLDLINQQLDKILNLSEKFILSVEKSQIYKYLNEQLVLIRISIEHNLFKMSVSENKLEELNCLQKQLIYFLFHINYQLIYQINHKN